MYGKDVTLIGESAENENCEVHMSDDHGERWQWHSQGGERTFKLVHDSIKPPVWSGRFVAKFV